MGLRINTNVASLSAQSNLKKTSGGLNQSLTRLSTGLRINTGSDDVVGLLTSEVLRSQIRGIGVAQLNISNVKSALGVAEGGLNQLTSIAQQIREKIVQAADANISSTDRDNIKTAVNDLINEFGRIANANNFNNNFLLTGLITGKNYQIGPTATDLLTITISDARASNIGKVAQLTSVTVASVAQATTALFTDPSGISINGVTIATSAFSNDGISKVEASESAIAYVNAINSISGQSKVSATVLANVVTLTGYSATSQGALTAGDTVYINDIAIAQGDYYANSLGATNLVSAINNVTTLTGVSAQINTTASALVLSAADGRNIKIKTVLAASTTNGLVGFAAQATLSAVSGYRGTFKLYSDAAFTLANGSPISASTAVGLDTNTTLNNTDVTTADNATTALFILDNVIRQLQTSRSNVGSKVIRVGVAEDELATRLENITLAESTIRDTDIASETANLTRAQILQQAGVSVLQRANALPQLALTLLQSG